MESELADEWLLWMKTAHIPEVMETGCFTEYKIMKVLTNAEDDAGAKLAL